MKKIEYVFILGSPRSGTSILGELIASHAKVHYIFETRNVWQKESVTPVQRKIGERLSSHTLTEADYKKKDAEKIFNYFNNSLKNTMPPLSRFYRLVKWLLFFYFPKKIIVEKNPRNSLRIPYIKAIIPNAKFIHIIRDGRDVTCSLLPGIGGKYWNHARPDNYEKLTAFDSIKRCALTWQEIVLTVEREFSKLPDNSKHVIKYESLLDDTKSEAIRLFDFLKLKITPGISEVIKTIQNETEQSYHALDQLHWYRANHKKRIGRYRENLSAEQQKEVLKLLGGTLNKFGYL